MQNTFTNLAMLRRLHELGVELIMDDFGTGYASLSYLINFPFSKIKIDRSFISDLVEKSEIRAVVRAIVDLARNLKMRVIAEGVATAQQSELLRKLGCLEVQGYLFGHPCSAVEIRRFLTPYADRLHGKNSAANRVA